MQGAREIQRMGAGILIALAAVALSAAYWAVAGSETILRRDDNPRLFEAVARIRRGSIYDSAGLLLAESGETDAGIVRRYFSPSTYSLVGYYSLRYGVGLAEAAFHDILNGSDEARSLGDVVSRKLLKIPQAGADVQLTASGEIQNSLVSALAGNPGAGVVMDARTGAIRAMASQPGYDPNSLDDDWDELASAPGESFFHRALQGQYQPGSAMLMFWLAEALQAGIDLYMPYDNADKPVALGGDMRVACALQPPGGELSILEAYIYGCPSPFLELRSDLPAGTFDSLSRFFVLAEPIVLAGFPAPEGFPAGAAAEEGTSESEQGMRGEALGQGRLTITPLHLTVIMSAIANDGSAPSPRLLEATREPGAKHWAPVAPLDARREMMSAETALGLRQALYQAWATISGKSTPDGANVGAQIARSQSGDGHQVWLYGFVDAGEGALAFALLLEDRIESAELIAIGNDLVDALLGHRR